MALDARTRSSIYEKLRPMLGDDDANALMSQFPASEGDQLVTRDLLRAELAENRTLTNIEFAAVRSEMQEGFAEVRSEMQEGFAEVRSEMQEGFAAIRAEFNAELGDVRKDVAGLRVEIADLRTDFADLRTELKTDIGVLRVEMHDLHRQTMKWMVGSTFTAMGLFAVIVRLTA